MPRKKAKNENALQHGVYSSTVLLPGEKRSDYEALRQSYFDEWVPDGASEQYLVEDLCNLRWKKQRLDQYDQIRLQQRKDKIREENNVDKLCEELRDLAEEFSETRGVEEVEDILRQLSATIKYIIHQRVPREKCTDLTKWGQEIGSYLSSLKQVTPLRGADLFAAMVDPVLMEIEIARSCRLDDAIDRTIKRLMQVKAAKQVFPNMRKHAKPEPKLISAPETAAAQPSLVFERQLESAKSVISAKPESESVEGGVVIEGSCFDEGEPPQVASTPITNEPAALFATNQPPPTMLTAVVTSAMPEVGETEFTADAVVVPEESHLNEGEPRQVSSTLTTYEPPALLATDESTPAMLNEVVTSAMPEVGGTELTTDAVVVPEESYLNEGEPPQVTSTPTTNEPPALFATDEPRPATLNEVVTPAKPEVEDGECAVEAGFALEGSHIGKSGPALILSTPIMVEQPAVVPENQMKPPSAKETVISANPEVQTFTTKAGVAPKDAPIEEGVLAPVSAISEKVHFGLLLGIGEVFAEQPPFCLEEMQAFSALCNEVHRSNAANNQTRLPGAGTT